MVPNQTKKNIHDAFVRRFFRDKRFAIDIFRKALSPAQFALFAWESLKPEETSFFDHEGNEKKADLVFSVKLKKDRKPANLVILLEHKSYNDTRMMQQILEYLTVLHAKHGKPVIPILLHQGPRKLKTALRFRDTLEDMTPSIRKHFGGALLDFTCLPVDIQSFNWKDENLTSGPIFYILSSIRRASFKSLEEFAKLCEKVRSKRIREILLWEGTGYFNRYDPEKFSWDRIGKVLTNVFKDEGDNVMKRVSFLEETAKEMGWEKGHKEGREEGRKEERREMALQMLEKGIDIATISEISGLTKKQIRELDGKKAA